MKYTRAVRLHEEGSLIKRIGKNTFNVDKKFHWWINYEDKKEYIIVNTGFETDFGSIPRLLCIFFNPVKYIAYILHDKLYRDKFVIQEDGTKRYITRKEADQILFIALLVEGCTIMEARCIYAGVRIGGWYYWNHS